MKIEANRLILDDGQSAPFRQTPNISQGRTIDPQYLVIHYTAGSSFDSSVNWLTNPDAQASAHLVIGRDGEIMQLADFTARFKAGSDVVWIDAPAAERPSPPYGSTRPGLTPGR